MYQHKRRWALWVALCLCLSLALPTLATAESVPEATPTPNPTQATEPTAAPTPSATPEAVTTAAAEPTHPAATTAPLRQNRMASQPVTVTLRVELMDMTLVAPVAITVAPGKDYQADFGLNITEPHPDGVTALDVLAAYIQQTYGNPVSASMDITPSGILTTLLGSSGSSDPAGGKGWEFRVNHRYPTYPDRPGVGSLLTDTLLQDGDSLVLFGSTFGAVDSCYTYFSQENIQTLKGANTKVTLVSGNGKPVPGATILCDEKDNADSIATTPTTAVTNEKGEVFLTFPTVGEYVLSAARSAGGEANISRPYATVTVADTDEAGQILACEQDLAALCLPERPTEDLDLPTQGQSGLTTVTWTSNQEAVVSAAGHVVRPLVGQPDAQVTLKAVVAFGDVARETTFSLIVPAYTQAEVEDALQTAEAALQGEEGQLAVVQYDKLGQALDANLLTCLQARVEAVAHGVTVTLTDVSAHSQIAPDGAIAYGDDEVSATVGLVLTLSGVERPVSLTVVVPASVMTKQQAVDQAVAGLSFDSIKNKNTAADAIRTNLNLPSYDEETWADIKWKSSNPSVVNVGNGASVAEVTRPNCGEPAVQVTLTATVSAGFMMDYMAHYVGVATPRTLTFTLTVLPYEEQECRAAIDAVIQYLQSDEFQVKETFYGAVVPAPYDLTYDVTLPTLLSGMEPRIAWASSQPASVQFASGSGRAALTRGAVDVSANLTATISLGGLTGVFTLPVTVKALEQAEIDAANAYLQEAKASLTFETICKDNAASDQVTGNLQIVRRGSKQDGVWTWVASAASTTAIQAEWTYDAVWFNQSLSLQKRPQDGQSAAATQVTATLTHPRYAQYPDQVPAVTCPIDLTIAPYDNTVTGLAVNGTAVDFDPDTQAYALAIAQGDTSFELAVTQADPDPAAAVRVNGQEAKGKNPVTVTVAMEAAEVDATVQGVSAQPDAHPTYTVTVRYIADLPDYESEWDSFRSQSGGVTTAYTPRTEEEAQLNWATKVGGGWMSKLGSPILVNGKVYMTSSSELLEINQQTGAIEQRVTLAGSTNLLAYLTYGGGMFFVPLSNGRIQAFNAQTLEPLWISAALPNHQSISPLVYHDGYLYTGTFVGNVTTSTDGRFYCLDTADQNPSRTDEEVDFLWSCAAPETASRKGFYWTGAAIAGDRVVFGSDSGLLYSHSLTGTEQPFTFDAGSDIRCSITYDAASRSVYFTTTGGRLYAVPLEADGSFGQARYTEISPSTSTPLLYNGRIYVTGGSMMASGNFTVLDAQSLDILYSADLGDVSQSSVLLSTAYANAANDYTVYLYVTLNAYPGGILRIEDSAHNVTPKVTALYTPDADKQQYCVSSVIADRAGNLYYTNDSGYLFSIGNQPITVSDVVLTETAGSLAVGERLTLTPQVLPENAPDKSLIWSSDREEVATVKDGVIQAVGPGTAVITARASDSGNRRDRAPEAVYVLTVREQSAQPTATVSPSVTPTAGPTATPSPAATPTALATAQPTAAPQGQTPSTGDDGRPVLWLALSVLALSVLGAGLRRRHKA